jgi:hypothetical protein
MEVDIVKAQEATHILLRDGIPEAVNILTSASTPKLEAILLGAAGYMAAVQADLEEKYGKLLAQNLIVDALTVVTPLLKNHNALYGSFAHACMAAAQYRPDRPQDL